MNAKMAWGSGFSTLNLRRAVLLTLIAAMESCYIYALLALLTALIEPPYTLMPLPLFAAYWFALVVGRALPSVKRPPARLIAATIALALATILAVVYLELYTHLAWYDPGWLARYGAALWRLRSNVADLILSVGTLYVFIRAIGLARRPLSLWYVGLLFRIGVVVFFVVFIAASILETYDAATWIVAYFGLALVALALARIEEIGQVRLGPRWGMTLLGAAALVLLLGVMLAQVFTVETAHIAWLILAPLWIVLGLLLVAFAIPAGYLAEWLVNLLKPAFDRFALAMQDLQNTLPFDSDLIERATQATPNIPFLEPLLQTAVVLIALVIVGRLVARVLNRRMQQIEANAYAREALSAADADRRPLDSPKPRAPRSRPRHIVAETIRRIYAALVARAAAGGLPRHVAETPYEFLPRLTQRLPEHTNDLRAITEAYIAVHYGELDAPLEQVNLVRAAWQRVERTMRAMRTPHSPTQPEVRR